jgi:Cytochrome c554 and c-prime
MLLSRLCPALLLAGGTLLASGPSYVGAEACATCHRAEYNKQIASRHAHALRPIAQSPLFTLLSGEINPTRNSLIWAFGAGAQGITPVGIVGGRYFENRFSYFPGTQRVALTFGHPARASTENERLGFFQDSRTITRCFNCHATNVQPGPTGPDLSHMTPGVTCERCHGPGRDHVAEVRTKLLNPGRLSSQGQVQVCGECHRLPQPGDSGPEPEIEEPVSVRFAPVGLMASRCFTESRKLGCTTCHDPHTDAPSRNSRFYAERCLTCHTVAPTASSSCARTQGGNCLPCHMRQVSLTDTLKFTDHRIRIY